VTCVTSGKFLFLCLVPVIGWGVWFFPKTKRQYSEEEDLQRHGSIVMSSLNVQVQQVCDKILLRTASRTARRSLALYRFVGNYA
jgi:hypothetical protein